MSCSLQSGFPLYPQVSPHMGQGYRCCLGRHSVAKWDILPSSTSCKDSKLPDPWSDKLNSTTACRSAAVSQPGIRWCS